MGIHEHVLRDLTKVETVYRKRLRTVRIKLRRDHAGTGDIELVTVTNPGDVHEIARAIYAGLDDDQEHFVLLVCSAAHEIVGFKVVASGAQDHVFVDAKLVFRNALLLGAYHIIALHNHPAGDLTPSPGDLRLTSKLVAAGRVLDVELLDHVIYSSRGFLSLREHSPHLFDHGGAPAEQDAPDSSG